MQYEEIEAIVRKGEDDEKRERRQFGLPKLLLWTAAAALVLSALRMLGLGPIPLACIAGWVAVTAGVRLAWGSPVTFVFSIVAGGIAGGCLALADFVGFGPGGFPAGAAMGGWAGYLSYVILEAAFCLVGLPDGLLRAKSYDRQGPP
jgi:hypothetical protein